MRELLLMLGGAVLAGGIVWLVLLPWYVNRQIKNFQDELVDKHYAEVENMYRKMRGWRHDYHNHMQVLKAHMALKQYDQAGDYLDKLESDLTTVDTVLKTGNVMVDAILNSKLSLIGEKNIAVDATALVPGDIGISGVDLAVVIGNLLDNAMEACMEIDEERQRFIRIYIDIMKKQLYISVTNSTKGVVSKIGSSFVTTKSGNHGYGLLRIDSIVHKYHGYINRQAEDGIFATEIMVPLE